ncbi:DUF523 domain-containing protein [Desulfofalx alkaliphila]|uniref:DUF523 domain-containing protein n=1 Tax=Desulfofalx alkaliphila TaxID=105483 RepID=UPI0004E1E4A8|nr:DUF523 domain-containing protein [Desulfofalx alkaliphila]
MKGKILVSACLAGQNCRYDGGNNLDLCIAKMVEEGRAIPVCPEEMGGLPTPRLPCEIKGGDGRDVIAGDAAVWNNRGKNVTGQFVAGAKEILKIARQEGVKAAILKERSPSCGVLNIYDGTFRGVKIPGQGVLAALLAQEGIKIYSEENYSELLR